MTLEQQLDTLIAEHRLSSISLTRIAASDGGRSFWAINAQGDGKSATADYGIKTPEAGITDAIQKLNALRTAPVVVPVLEMAA